MAVLIKVKVFGDGFWTQPFTD